MANYNITVLPITERVSRIELESNSSTRTHRFYDFRSETIDLKVIRLSIDTPIYRVANYRTNILQLSWIKRKGLEKNYFLEGQENESVQSVQHEFLWDLAQTEKESIKSIVDTLEEEKQREPILITATGVVVNGNRRLSAMRELNFSHVDCMVLPNTANEDDLKEIEVRLQMTPETRLPYGWINECIAISDLRDSGKPIDKIAELMRLAPPKVKDKLQMLTEIDLYLNEWRKNDIEYEDLTNAYQIFSEVTKRINKKDGTAKEIARNLAWILIDNRGDEGRIYNLRETTGSLTQSVVDKLQEVYSSEMQAENDDDGVQLEFELDENPTGAITDQGVINFLKSFRNNQQKQDELISICGVVVETKKNTDIGNSALKFVIEANTRLIEVDLTSAIPATYPSILKQLDNIESRAAHLKSEIARYISNQDKK